MPLPCWGLPELSSFPDKSSSAFFSTDTARWRALRWPLRQSRKAPSWFQAKHAAPDLLTFCHGLTHVKLGLLSQASVYCMKTVTLGHYPCKVSHILSRRWRCRRPVMKRRKSSQGLMKTVVLLLWSLTGKSSSEAQCNPTNTHATSAWLAAVAGLETSSSSTEAGSSSSEVVDKYAQGARALALAPQASPSTDPGHV